MRIQVKFLFTRQHSLRIAIIVVSGTSPLPNVRKMFRPDPGYMLIDADLERADAQVVAWEAGDTDLKTVFKERLDVHSENAKAIFRTKSPTEKERYLAKTAVHAVNYGAKARTLAQHIDTSVSEAEDFISRWFAAHPKIAEWHRSVEDELQRTRSVRNAWGYRRYYFDRLESILPKALAYIGQSTVAITINHALVNIYKNVPECQLLLQNHDSLVLQTALDNCPAIYRKIEANLLVPIPFLNDPLIINCSMKVSPKSWGEVEKVTW